MENWINSTLESPTLTPSVLLAALLFGFLGCVTNCCNLPIIGAVVGYSGSVERKPNRKDIIVMSLSFMLGTVVSLAILGAITGFVSQTIGATVGKYWKFFAGFIIILIGLGTLNLLPFKIPKFKTPEKAMPVGTTNALLYGLAIGGAATACSVGCSPVLPVALGVCALQGNTVWGAVILAVFAVGYSLPMAIGLMGISFGLDRLRTSISKIEPYIKTAAGILLLGVGFYMLASA